MSGYCAMGRPVMASAPASMMTMATTQAKIGRSMKKRDSMAEVLAARGDDGGLHRRAGAHPLQPLDDHLLAGPQPAGHEPVVAHRLSDRERPRFGLAARAH